MQFKNNFERDVWYDWFTRRLTTNELGTQPCSKEDAAAFADEVLQLLQLRTKPE